MAKELKKRNHSVYGLYYHIILTVKYRKKLMARYDNFIKEVISKVAVTTNFCIERMESDQDHIHILVSARPNISPSQIVSVLKQVTTFELWQEYGSELSKQFWKEHTFWSPSYFVYSLGSVSKEVVDRYIANQGHSSRAPKGTGASGQLR